MRFIHRHAVLFFCVVLMVGLVYSPFLLSVAMFSLAGLCFFSFEIGKGEARFRWNTNFWRSLGQYPRHLVFLVPSLLFFMVLFSYFQAEDMGYWWERMRIKVPFLAIGMLFMVLPRMTARELDGLFLFLVFMMTVTSIGVGINYLLNYQEIIALMKEGQPIPTPRNHIRFSITLAFSILAGIILIRKHFSLRYSWERKVLIGATAFLFLMIHFLSVRTGMLVLYAGLFALTLQIVIENRKWWLLLAVTMGLSALPVIGYYAIPSFQTKINYMRWDWMQFQEGKGAEYADSGRLSSLIVGWELWKQHPVLGVGMGNLRNAVEKEYTERFPAFEQPHMPHNQFLFIAAGSGGIGLAAFIFGFFYPLFYKQNYRHPYLLAFYAIITTAFMLEHTVENSIGVGFVCFFLFLMLNVFNRRT
jgi:O-antigen ligase